MRLFPCEKNLFDIEKYLNKKEKIKPGDEFIVVDADSLPPVWWTGGFNFSGQRGTPENSLLPQFTADNLRFQVCTDGLQFFNDKGETTMEFFNSAIEVLQTLVVALGAGLGVWGAINLLEGYGNDNPGSNAHVR